MSWLSIPNPFKSLQFAEDEYEEDDNDDHEEKTEQNPPQHGENDAVVVGGGGVKEDLSAIGESLSRQFRGVAAFLAPPPDEAAAASSSTAIAGFRSDLAEIGGSFKNTLSIFSSPNKAVSEISKFASNFLQSNNDDNVKNDDDDYDYNNDDEFVDGDEEEYGVGLTDDVLEFARRISERPELWTDFPLSLDDHDFDMSDRQIEHATMVEQLVPSLAALRGRISADISELHFWMIYFILLLPRLNFDDLELLSTPQTIEARETLLMMLERKKDEEINSEDSQSYSSSKVDDAEQENSDTVGDVVSSEPPNALRNTESNVSDTSKKLAVVEDAKTVTSTEHDPLHAKTDNSESSRTSRAGASAGNSSVGLATKAVDHSTAEEAKSVPSETFADSKSFHTEDDVSFSDLEDEDNDLHNRESSPGPSQLKRNSSTEGSTGWVRLNEGTRESQVRGQSSSRDRDSEGEESIDWLTVDDFEP